jgi:ergothioneine biosynthesis protein EgtB
MTASPALKAVSATPRERYLESFRNVRRLTEELCRPLAVEDYVVQSMPDASPAKWHLAHTNWFFETFLLGPTDPSYRSPDPLYTYLFNSYYVQVGERFSRPERGLLSRPTVEQVYEYRAHVDRCMTAFFERADDAVIERLAPVIELGLHHEQQHQELILTDIKHMLSVNPLRPAYRSSPSHRTASAAPPEHRWLSFDEGLYAIGHDGDSFAFDNESPRHQLFVHAFRIGSRLITNSEYQRFIDDGGYRRPELWLSDGSKVAEAQGWTAPAYWTHDHKQPKHFTLHGLRELDPNEPVCHVSYYEADAFARWAGARLPTEAEWEVAAVTVPVEGRFSDSEYLHPAPAAASEPGQLTQMFGDAWEWTQSPYVPYPGFRPASGAIGEYNGKFMCNQMVLRGGSCATPSGHIRPTYRNFFPPEARWQFSGIRLAEDA